MIHIINLFPDLYKEVVEWKCINIDLSRPYWELICKCQFNIPIYKLEEDYPERYNYQMTELKRYKFSNELIIYVGKCDKCNIGYYAANKEIDVSLIYK